MTDESDDYVFDTSECPIVEEIEHIDDREAHRNSQEEGEGKGLEQLWIGWRSWHFRVLDDPRLEHPVSLVEIDILEPFNQGLFESQ